MGESFPLIAFGWTYDVVWIPGTDGSLLGDEQHSMDDDMATWFLRA